MHNPCKCKNDIYQQIYQECSINFADSSYYTNRINRNSILFDIFLGPRKGTFSILLCKRLFCKMYLYEDRTENRRGPSKTPKDDKYILKIYTRVGPPKDKGPRKGK